MTSSVYSRWLVRHRLVVLGALMALYLMVAAVPASASEGEALVYDNQTALDPGFTRFAQATNHDVTTVQTLPSDLSSYACVLLNLNQSPFSSGQVTTLSRYLAGGGSIIAIGDWGLFAHQADTSMNALVSSLGGHMSLNSDFVDAGFGATGKVDSSPLAAGVSSIQYAGASTISLSAPATGLVGSRSTGAPIVAAENLDGGVFVLLGDSNMINDDSYDAYTAHDNGTLMRNLCPDEEPIQLTGQPVSATEGQSFEGTVASMSGDPDSAPADHTVSIAWGDGSTSSGWVDASGMVMGSHTYAEEGSYLIRTTVTDSDSASNTASGTSTATVADAPLTAGELSPSTEGGSAGNASFTFTDANPNAQASDFTGTVDWGDGTSSKATLSKQGGEFQVSASHTYSQTGLYMVRMHVTDSGGSTAGAASQLLIYAFAAANGGSFVIGESQAQIGSWVDFWGSDWGAQNPLTSGSAPPAFKGFAAFPSRNPPACGGLYTTGPGDSSTPPASLPAYMGVYVSSTLSQHGPSITGDITHIVIVKTSSGHPPDRGGQRSGQVVARVC